MRKLSFAMLKLGIYAPAQDTLLHRIFRRGLTSATLLAGADAERFDRLMPQILLSNGVARTTNRGRFLDFDRTVQRHLLDLFPPNTPIAVEDWAISSGITAAEWFDCLKIDFPRVQFTGSDAFLNLIEARTEAGDIYILEADGTPIQYVKPPFVVSMVLPQNAFYFLNRRVQKTAQRRWNQLSGRLRLPEDWPDYPVAAPPFILRQLPLIQPDVLTRRGDAFQIRRHSIFENLREPVDVIRAMNILNRAYFSDSQLRDAAAAAVRSLKPGGVWVVGRTISEDPPTHDATIFQKHADGWRRLARIGAGAEIELLVQASPSTES
jgi:hypothetical protein